MLIQDLTGNHDRRRFDCGRSELNDWLQRIARQHRDKWQSRTFVAAMEKQPTQVCGYYALTLTELDSRQLSAEQRSRFPNRIPGVRLGRLAVDLRFQCKGLGELLLVDAIDRTRRVRTEAGAVGLFVDAIDEQAVQFYARFGFSPSPDAPLLLFLPVQE